MAALGSGGGSSSGAFQQQQQQQQQLSGEDEEETLANVPGQLGSSAADAARPRLGALFNEQSGGARRALEACTRKCLPTCTRGGEGAPGLGPLSVRREPGGVVFKEGFRSRSYCLQECAETCSLLAAPKGGGGGR